MRYLKSYKLFEELSDKELNRILDKISKSGLGSLSPLESEKLNNPDKFKDESEDKVSFDKDGNLLVNGKPPYTNVEEEPLPKKQTNAENKLPNHENLYDLVKDKYKNNKLIIIQDNAETLTALDKTINNLSRTYYIRFKSVKGEYKSSILKLVYNLNSRSIQNFKIYDNYSNEIDFNKLTIFLTENNISYDAFNTSWFFIEENYNNIGYDTE